VQVPAETPVTVPAEVTVAIEVLLLLHVPPAVESVRVIDEPTHVLVGPAIGAIAEVVVVTVKYTRTKHAPTV